MAVTDTTVFLGEFETKTLLELESRAPGVYPVRLMVRGNALLSSVFVKSAAPGATVKVNYYQTTSGTDDDPERLDLESHAALGPAQSGETDQILVTKIHNKPQLEVIVAGGAVEFGVYGTIVGYTTISGVAYNQIPVIETSAPGTVREATAVLAAAPQAEAVILTVTVPAGKFWRLRYAEVLCRGYGRWQLLVNGARVAAGLTSAARDHDRVNLPGYIDALAGQVVELRYTYSNGPAGMPIDAFVGLTEI